MGCNCKKTFARCFVPNYDCLEQKFNHRSCLWHENHLIRISP